MTKHELAALAVEDALKEARATVLALEKARIEVIRRNYKKARELVSEANSSASYVDHRHLRRAGVALEDCQ